MFLKRVISESMNVLLFVFGLYRTEVDPIGHVFAAYIFNPRVGPMSLPILILQWPAEFKHESVLELKLPQNH